MGEVSQGGLVGRGEGINPARGQFLPANEPFDQDEAAQIQALRNAVFGLERAVPVLIDVGLLGQAAANELLRQALAGENANIIQIAGGVLQVIGEGDNADEPLPAGGDKEIVVQPDAELVFPAGMAAGIDVQATILTITNHGKITQECDVLVRLPAEDYFLYQGCGEHEMTELANALIEVVGADDAGCAHINFGGTVNIVGLTGSTGAVHVGARQEGSLARALMAQTKINLLQVADPSAPQVLLTADLAAVNDVVTNGPVNFSVFDLVRARILTTAAPSASNVIEADSIGGLVIDSQGGATAWSVGAKTPGATVSASQVSAAEGTSISWASPFNANILQAISSAPTAPASQTTFASPTNSVAGNVQVSGVGGSFTASNGGAELVGTVISAGGGSVNGGPATAGTATTAGGSISVLDPVAVPIP